MANNPFVTPTGTPWALPPASGGTTSWGTLFNTTTYTNNLKARWGAVAPSIYAPLFGTSGWDSTTATSANTGFGHALKFLATGNATEATNAYNAAVAESFTQETDNQRIWCDSTPFVYAWCKSALSAAQQGTLIAQGESFTAQRETALVGHYLMDGPGNGGGSGLTGYVFGCCAFQGASANGQSFTDRRTNLRNLVNNQANYLQETYGDGWRKSYAYITTPQMYLFLAYHIATGELSQLVSRIPHYQSRPEVLCRLLSSDGNHYWRVPTYNAYIDVTGRIQETGDPSGVGGTPPENATGAAVLAEICNQNALPTQASMATYVNTQKQANSNSGRRWTNNLILSDSSWMALLFNNESLVAESAAQASVPLCNAFTTTGITEFRCGWNQGTDLVVDYNCGLNPQNDHSNNDVSSFQVRVGNTLLIRDGYGYGGRPSNWENAAPFQAGEVGAYQMCKSAINFTSAANESGGLPDRGGSPSTTIPSNSGTTYLLSKNLTGNVRTTWVGGTTGSFTTTNVLSQVTGTLSVGTGNLFPQVTTSASTQVGFVPGVLAGNSAGAGGLNNTDVGTIVVWDQWSGFSSAGAKIRRYWFGVNQPTIGTATVLQGAASAGVLSGTGGTAVFVNGAYQVTVQCVSTLDTTGLYAVGGVGFENFYDGYESGGANMDFLSNTQSGGSDVRAQREAAWFTGQWRAVFKQDAATAGNEMITVITVGLTGSTAPTYNRTSALALFTPVSTGIMPGISQYWSGKLLNATTGRSSLTLPSNLYAAAFTTVPSDSGAGAVEPTGNGYTRATLAANGAAWNLAVTGSPTTVTNASDIVWPQSTGSWGTINGVGFYDAANGGNLIMSDYL